MLWRGSATTAISKSSRFFRCFGDFRGDGGSLVLKMPQKFNSILEAKLFYGEKMA